MLGDCQDRLSARSAGSQPLARPWNGDHHHEHRVLGSRSGVHHVSAEPTSRSSVGGTPTNAGRWTRAGLVALLALTALAYLWDLSASGFANGFYAAAVQAGTKSWKAFFFGSIDSSNFITVDKTPASLWIMELSGRLFGFNSWSMLVPQALEGVAAVALLFAAVKRWFGAAAGLLAGLVLASTPVAALMFRFNNPDASARAAPGGQRLHPDPRPREGRDAAGWSPPARSWALPF